MNKDGSPDLRFRDNRELPIVLYGDVALWSDSDFNLILQVTRLDIIDLFGEAVRRLAAYRRHAIMKGDDDHRAVAAPASSAVVAVTTQATSIDIVSKGESDMSRKGPFGLWMGMTADDFEGDLEEVAPCKYRTPIVPKPHSAFEFYVVQIPPRAGLAWIKAIGKTVDTSAYGLELKSAFEAMEAKLSATYGRHKKYDFLMQDSIWDEPRDWMAGLQNGERVLMAEWSNEHRSSLADALVSVALFANAVDTTLGYLAIEYTFENGAMADAEIAALEDDAL